MAAAADMLRRCTTRFASNGPCNCGEKLDLRNYYATSKFQTIISKFQATTKISIQKYYFMVPLGAIAALVNLNLHMTAVSQSKHSWCDGNHIINLNIDIINGNKWCLLPPFQNNCTSRVWNLSKKMLLWPNYYKRQEFPEPSYKRCKTLFRSLS